MTLRIGQEAGILFRSLLFYVIMELNYVSVYE